MKTTTEQGLECLGAPWHSQGLVVINRRGTRVADLSTILGFEYRELRVATRVIAAAPGLYRIARTIGHLPRDHTIRLQYPTLMDDLREAVEAVEIEQ